MLHEECSVEIVKDDHSLQFIALVSTSPQVTALELKFLLGLLYFPGYRGPIAQIRSLGKLSLAGRERLCQQLTQRGYVNYENIARRFGLTATGRTLLELDTSVLPITPDEKYVLQSCRDRSITPQQIHGRIPQNQRQALIYQLAQQGLLRITQQQVGDVWLTSLGQTFLRDDYVPQGDSPVISLTLMSHYLQFMRQSLTPTNP